MVMNDADVLYKCPEEIVKAETEDDKEEAPVEPLNLESIKSSPYLLRILAIQYWYLSAMFKTAQLLDCKFERSWTGCQRRWHKEKLPCRIEEVPRGALSTADKCIVKQLVMYLLPNVRRGCY